MTIPDDTTSDTCRGEHREVEVSEIFDFELPISLLIRGYGGDALSARDEAYLRVGEIGGRSIVPENHRKESAGLGKRKGYPGGSRKVGFGGVQDEHEG